MSGWVWFNKKKKKKFKKIVGASWLKKGILSQKFLSLKYFSKCPNKLKVVLWFLLFVLLTFPTYPYVGFSLLNLGLKNAF
jgi:hypothetical protein